MSISFFVNRDPESPNVPFVASISKNAVIAISKYISDEDAATIFRNDDQFGTVVDDVPAEIAETAMTLANLSGEEADIISAMIFHAKRTRRFISFATNDDLPYDGVTPTIRIGEHLDEPRINWSNSHAYHVIDMLKISAPNGWAEIPANDLLFRCLNAQEEIKIEAQKLIELARYAINNISADATIIAS